MPNSIKMALIICGTLIFLGLIPLITIGGILYLLIDAIKNILPDKKEKQKEQKSPINGIKEFQEYYKKFGQS